MGHRYNFWQWSRESIWMKSWSIKFTTANSYQKIDFQDVQYLLNFSNFPIVAFSHFPKFFIVVFLDLWIQYMVDWKNNYDRFQPKNKL